MTRRIVALFRPRQQNLGQSRGDVEKTEVQRPLVGVAQAGANHLQDVQTDGGMTLEKRQDIAPLQGKQLAGGQRGRVGGSFLAVQHRHLAQYGAALQIGENDGAPVPLRQGNADLAAEEDHHALAGRPITENHLTGCKMPARRAFQQLDAVVVAERAKHGALIEQACIVARVLTVAHRIPSALGPPDGVHRRSDHGVYAVIEVTPARAP